MCVGAMSERFYRAEDKPRIPNVRTQTVHLSANYQATYAEPIDKEKLRASPSVFLLRHNAPCRNGTK